LGRRSYASAVDGGLQSDTPDSNEKDLEVRKQNEKTFYSVGPEPVKKAAREEASHSALVFLAQNGVHGAESALAVFGLSAEEKCVRFNVPFEGGAEEAKNLEFKGGPKISEPQPFEPFMRMFGKTMGRYVCAFRNGLNGGGRGRICYGVHDSGFVQGVIFSDPRRQKDRVNLEYDRQMHLFYPPLVNGRDMLLEFLPVKDGPVIDEGGLFVVCISTFVQRKVSPNLCWWDNGAFLRTEGSVRPMPAPRIEAYYKRKAWEEVQAWLGAQQGRLQSS